MEEYAQLLAAFSVHVKVLVWRSPERRLWIAFKPSAPGQSGVLATVDADAELPDGFEYADPEPIPVHIDDAQRNRWIDQRLRRLPILDPGVTS